MKTGIIAVVALLALSVPSAKGEMSIGILGSYWDQDEGDNVLGVGILVLPEALPIEIRATYCEEATHKLEAHPIDLGLALTLTQSDSYQGSVVGGGSYYILDSDRSSIDNEFGWYAGARLVLPAQDRFSVFAELLYRGADLKDEVNIDLSGLAFNVGLLF